MSDGTVLCIGTFDAVHRGHRALIGIARRLARPTGRVVALSFDPHPLSTLRPEHAPLRLTTFQQRSQYLRDAGADEVVRLEPTRDLLSQSPRQFVDGLVEQYRPVALVEGPDFRFGHKREGSVETLRQLGGRFGFTTEVIEPVFTVLSDQSLVRTSSSLLRWCLDHGRVRDAALLCDRPFELVGQVVRGDQRGRDLGMPTANLRTDEPVQLPGDGIYTGAAIRPDGQCYPAAISVGTKPTFGENPRVCEAHLIGFNGPLDEYGWRIRIQFADWLRDQIAFTSVEQLVEQLRRDGAAAARATPANRKQCQHA